MNKKVIYGILAVVVVIALIIGIYAVSNNNNNTPATQNIDLVALNGAISTKGQYDQMSTMPIDKEVAKSVYEIEENQIEEIIGAMPMMNVHASMYVVIKATDGNVENVKAKLETYGQSYEQQWERYLPEQYDLVKNRKIGTNGNYAYMIVAKNAEEVEALIK